MSVVSNWLIYLCVSFIPLTIFFIAVFAFRISAASPKLMSFVLLAQSIAIPASVRAVTEGLDNNPVFLWISKTVLTIYGIGFLSHSLASNMPEYQYTTNSCFRLCCGCVSSGVGCFDVHVYTVACTRMHAACCTVDTI